MKNGLLVLLLSFLLLITSNLSAKPSEYKCYVSASDSLHYIVIVEMNSAGMAARAARHVWINSPVTGKVGVQDVIECIALNKPFKDVGARKQEEKTPLHTIKNTRR